MAKSGRKLPTLAFKDLLRVVLADGWRRVAGTKHHAYEHPTKRGKVNLDAKWTGVRPGGQVFNSVLRQASLTRREFERLYWKERG